MINDKLPKLSDQQITEYWQKGHLTVADVFGAQTIYNAIQDIEEWSRQFLSQLDDDKKNYFLEKDIPGQFLRKLDNPVYERKVFRKMASDQTLVDFVEQLIGQGVCIYFSQIFCKSPLGSSPKCTHQDNFYFGPDDHNGMVTAWIALDESTIDNGCLFFGEETHKGPVYPHIAPAGEPFNLQVPADIASEHSMTPAPVPSGGVSFHHGNIFHQSSANQSNTWRRAAAFHYVNRKTQLVTPRLSYDTSMVIQIT
jgi:ectoine hydroxylase-related dioxygenase (phytanoyl-CoA dioxygenase family)